jgi:hypothetical protein
MSDAQHNLEFLLAAVGDTEGTIRATDTKASIALVLHGLVFSGLIGATERIGILYATAPSGLQIAVVVLLSVVVASSLSSVLCLLLCVAPAPACAIPDLPPLPASRFFLPMKAVGLISPRVRSVDAAYRESVASMDENARLDDLVREVLALSAIRARKITLIRRGLGLLGLEFIASLAYLTLLGAHLA